MNIAAIVAVASAALSGGASAFAPSSIQTALVRRSAAAYAPPLSLGREGNVDFGGNTWKPDSEKMGSTDTGDYFPEGYDKDEVDFTAGMQGSQGAGSDDRGPALPGMENLGADAVMMGGIDEASEVPDDMEFVMSSIPDGEIAMDVAANSSKGAEVLLSVKPVCMGFEDYYAGFAAGSHESFGVSPVAGRMDRRGGEPTELEVTCKPTELE